jgi:hypothetical protein
MLELPANRIASSGYFSLLSSCSNFSMSFSQNLTSGRLWYFLTGEQERSIKETNKTIFLRMTKGFGSDQKYSLIVIKMKKQVS